MPKCPNCGAEIEYVDVTIVETWRCIAYISGDMLLSEFSEYEMLEKEMEYECPNCHAKIDAMVP